MDPENADVVAYIGRWRPSSVSPGAAAFARGVIARAGPKGRERAKNLLWAAGKLADYTLGLGLDLMPEVVFCPSVIERFAGRARVARGGARHHSERLIDTCWTLGAERDYASLRRGPLGATRDTLRKLGQWIGS